MRSHYADGGEEEEAGSCAGLSFLLPFSFSPVICTNYSHA